MKSGGKILKWEDLGKERVIATMSNTTNLDLSEIKPGPLS